LVVLQVLTKAKELRTKRRERIGDLGVPTVGLENLHIPKNFFAPALFEQTEVVQRLEVVVS
ncbi:hypothetical protein, partial [Escherichia coli]|uniref:hypothetical protein n=1 Tax=Escherichia coli TaxID=562 RepID=UPI001BC899E6